VFDGEIDQDLRDDTRVYLERRAVGCVACEAGWQTIGSTLAALCSIIQTLRGWPTPMGAGNKYVDEGF
jgi:FMN reductase